MAYGSISKWTSPRKSGVIPSVRTRFGLSMEMSRLIRVGTAESFSRDQVFRRERGQGNIHFPCPADHEQDWQPYPVDSYLHLMTKHTITVLKTCSPSGCLLYQRRTLCASDTLIGGKNDVPSEAMKRRREKLQHTSGSIPRGEYFSQGIDESLAIFW